MFRVITEEPLELSGKVLIVPAVSVGNSGTLAIDLLLNSSIFKRKAWIYSSDFLPIVGLNALDSSTETLNFPLEIYEFEGLAVLSIRSLCTNPKGFTEKLVAWSLENHVLNILVVGSNWDEMKPREEEEDAFYMKNSLCSFSYGLSFKEFSQYKDFLEGSGLVKHLLEQSLISASAVLVYGKDIPADIESGYNLANWVLKINNLVSNLHPPRSWQAIR